MKKTLLFLTSVLMSLSVSAQFVAKMEVKEAIPGICNENEVYALISSFKGQQKAVCPVSKDDILKRLNNEVEFIKTNPDFVDKGMIGLVINCKGQVVKCKMDNKTKSVELDKQIEIIFDSLGAWKPGKLNGKEVDTSVLFSFDINNGKFTLK
jgi:hypothetical protein